MIGYKKKKKKKEKTSSLISLYHVEPELFSENSLSVQVFPWVHSGHSKILMKQNKTKNYVDSEHFNKIAP